MSNDGAVKINQFPIKVERRRYTKAPTPGSPSTRVSAVTMNRSRSIRLDFIGPKPGRIHGVIAVRTQSRPSGTPTERHNEINDRADRKTSVSVYRAKMSVPNGRSTVSIPFAWHTCRTTRNVTVRT